jgi:hypothetical protein
MRRAIENDRLATDFAQRHGEPQRLQELVKRLQQRVTRLTALAATDLDEADE